MKQIICLLLIILLLLAPAGCTKPVVEDTEPAATPEPEIPVIDEDVTEEKPVIYLYPEAEQCIHVEIEVDGELSCTYPAYNGGWDVIAQPDGTLTNLADRLEYSYLFWEAEQDTTFDFSKGFVVAGEDTAAFLQHVLPEMGLLPAEYNEFIVYWLPRMQNNPYNLISFQTNVYTDHARLTITPEPDSLLRVFMAYRPLEEPIEIEPQTFSPFIRDGFTVIEWGGAIVP